MKSVINQWNACFLCVIAKMSRDYAKKLTNSQRCSGFKIIMATLFSISVIAVIIALLFSVFCCHEKHEKKIAGKTTISTITIAPVKPPPMISVKSESQFKFYTLLPKMEVTIPLYCVSNIFCSFGTSILSIAYFIF